ncbi:MAG: hypothetical protein Q3988_05965 [Gemella sp.]|nr:hypothetical protein [Gemella sp.]
MKKSYLLMTLCLPFALSFTSDFNIAGANEQSTTITSSQKEEIISKLIIKEENKIVYTGEIVINEESDGDSYVIDVDDLEKYSVDRYYTYDNVKIEVDGKVVTVENEVIKIPKNSKEIVLNLAKRNELWNKVKVTYPKELAKGKREVEVKTYSTFEDFRVNNQAMLNRLPNPKENYTFSHYAVGQENINTYNNVITSDLHVRGIYNTKIVFKTYNNSLDTYYFKTGDKIDVNLARYARADYDIVSYDIINNLTNKQVASISQEELGKMLVEDSITIVPKYAPKKNKVLVRQDNYNKRFGKVDESLENYDAEWEATKPISGLLDELKKKIKPNDGYELQFRINRKPVDPKQFVKEETLLEIYFKKKEGSWVNVKFTGEGIDKFLSDGQEVLAGNRIDSINLPTSQGSSKEFVGWTANKDYKYQIDNKVLTKEKDSIIKTVDLPHVVTTKDQDLIFTAKYLENYTIRISSNGLGTALLTDSDNSFTIKEGTVVKDSIGNRRLLMVPNSHFQFSHLTADHAVMIRDEQGAVKLVRAGEKISQKDFYNIVVHRDLNIKVNFTFYDGRTSFDKSLIGNDDVLSLELKKNYNSRLEDALGPLNYLR